MKIYLAGPLFSIAEREFNRNLSEEIKKKIPRAIMFLPQEKAKGNKPYEEMFKDCINDIKDANIVIAILDGPDADSGTSFEVGYAHALGKHVIGIRTDFRELEENGLNLMLSQSIENLIKFETQEISIDSIVDKIVDIIKKLNI